MIKEDTVLYCANLISSAPRYTLPCLTANELAMITTKSAHHGSHQMQKLTSLSKVGYTVGYGFLAFILPQVFV